MQSYGISLSVMASQILLIGLALAWGIHTALLISHGSVRFVEPNQLILWYEIVSTAAIALYGMTMLIVYLFAFRRRTDVVVDRSA